MELANRITHCNDNTNICIGEKGGISRFIIGNVGPQDPYIQIIRGEYHCPRKGSGFLLTGALARPRGRGGKSSVHSEHISQSCLNMNVSCLQNLAPSKCLGEIC